MSSVATPHRFYCPQLAETGLITLAETEAHHAIHVLRSRPNDVVELFNGSGLVAGCRIVAVRKRDLELEVISHRREAASHVSLTIATAVPKGDRFDWLVEKATELGVSRLIPLTTARSIVDPRTSKLDKLRQTVIAACKQSGRSHLMEISPVMTWSDFVKQYIASQRVCLAHPGGRPMDVSITNWQPTAVAIGPEGGFRDDEIQTALTAGAQLINLGSHILRVETAAIAFAARILC